MNTDLEFLREDMKKFDPLEHFIEKNPGRFGELYFIRLAIPGLLYGIISKKYNTENSSIILIKDMVPEISWNEIGVIWFIIHYRLKTNLIEAERVLWYLIESKDRKDLISKAKSYLILSELGR